MWTKASVGQRVDIKKPPILYAGKMPYNKHKVKRGWGVLFTLYHGEYVLYAFMRF
jgi:hypothetical protein